MATTKKHLVSIRTNTSFVVDYQTNHLIPIVEIILLSREPKYEVNKKGEITKGIELGEFRIFAESADVNDLIGKLQALATQLQSFEQLGSAINTVIENVKEK